MENTVRLRCCLDQPDYFKQSVNGCSVTAYFYMYACAQTVHVKWNLEIKLMKSNLFISKMDFLAFRKNLSSKFEI